MEEIAREKDKLVVVGEGISTATKVRWIDSSNAFLVGQEVDGLKRGCYSHENVSSNGEIFSVKERRSDISLIRKTLDKLYNLDWFSSAAQNECTSAVGLKWMINQGLMQNHQKIVEFFNRGGVHAIFLFRRNHLQRYVSILAKAIKWNS